MSGISDSDNSLSGPYSNLSTEQLWKDYDALYKKYEQAQKDGNKALELSYLQQLHAILDEIESRIKNK